MNSTAIASGSNSSVVRKVLHAHERLFAWLARRLDGWFIGLAARVVVVAVLLPYYFNSALTKPGEGLFGVFTPAAGAFAQILPSVAEQYGYDTSAIPFMPWHVIVILGTLAEFALPVLIAIGLFTRWRALGLIGFIAVQTFVDLTFHGAAPGMLLDNQPTDLLDHRLLWMFPLLVLAVRGPGRVSLDAWLRHRVLDPR